MQKAACLCCWEVVHVWFISESLLNGEFSFFIRSDEAGFFVTHGISVFKSIEANRPGVVWCKKSRVVSTVSKPWEQNTGSMTPCVHSKRRDFVDGLFANEGYAGDRCEL